MSENYKQLPAKPKPQVASGNEPYWQALREHRLVVQRCTNCNQRRHYPRPMCNACYSMEFDWQEMPARGFIHSWTVTHHPFHPGFKQDVPYATVTIDLEPGIRLQAPLLGDPHKLAAGIGVNIDFVDVDEGVTIPCARIANN